MIRSKPIPLLDFPFYHTWFGIIAVILVFTTSDSLVLANSQGGQQLQCYACGLPKVHPEYDVVGSYGLKKYNHSCEEMLDSKKNNNQIDQAFIRTCPVGVKSCFGATGFYDHKDNDKTNDIWIRFLGCSEAKYQHDYGCDKELQNVDVKDKTEKKIKVNIEVKLCFCSQHLCNDLDGELMTSEATNTKIPLTKSTFFAVIMTSLFLGQKNQKCFTNFLW